MSKNVSEKIKIVFGFFLGLASIFLVFGSYVVIAQTPVSGDWSAKFSAERDGKLQLTFARRVEKGGRNTMGQSYSFDELQGLSREQASGSGAVRFSLTREAGTIDCEGSFQNGKGTGTFRFTPNQNFISAMKSRGFDFEETSSSRNHDSENKLFAAAALNVTTAFTDDLLSANFGDLNIDDLFKARIFNVTSQFMSEMKAIGFPNLDMEDLIKARIFKVDADYIRQVREMGFKDSNMESLTKLRIFKVTPGFISEVRAEGLVNLSIEELVKLRIFKIDAAFIRQAKAENVPLEIEKLVQRRIGVWGK